MLPKPNASSEVFIKHLKIPCLGLNAHQEIVYFNNALSLWLKEDPNVLHGKKAHLFFTLEQGLNTDPGSSSYGHYLRDQAETLPVQLIHFYHNDQIDYFQIIETPPKAPSTSSLSTPPFFELTQEIAGTGLWAWTVGADHVTWSKQTYEIFRVPIGEPIDFGTYMSLIHPDDQQELQTSIEQTLNGKTLNIEHRLILRDGSIRYVTCLGQLLPPTDQPPQLLGVIRDVTDLRLTEAALKASETRWEKIFKHSHVGVLLLDSKGQIKDINPHAKQMLALSDSVCLFQELLHPEDLKSIEPALNELFAGKKKPLRIETRFYSSQKQKNEFVWVDVSISQMFKNKKCHVIAILTDITPQKHYQEALYTSEERLSLALKGANDGLWDWNIQTDHVYFSPRWKSMLGYDEHEIKHHLESFNSLIHPDDKEHTFNEIDKFLVGDIKVFEIEFRMKHVKGHYIPILSRGFLVRDPHNKNPLRIVGTHVDLSDLKHKEAALKKAKEEAERANQTKSDFLANMSHELRTPLNAILGFSKWLKQRPNFAPREQVFLERVHANAIHLLHLINDLLDIAKLETGRVSIDVQSIELAPFMHELIENARPLIEKNGNRVQLKLLSAIPEFTTDPLRLKQILFNLLSNAAKFTHKGNIVITVREQNDKQLHFSIQDTGIGIKEKFLPKLFKNFSQENTQLNREYEGTGLGLAISYKLAKFLGGDIKVNSTPKVGSTFTLELPCQ